MFNFIKKRREKITINHTKRIVIEVFVIACFFVILGLINKNFLLFSSSVHFTYSYPENQLIITPLTPVNNEGLIGQSDALQYQVNKQMLASETTNFSVQLPEPMGNNFSEAVITVQYNPQNESEALLGIKNASTGDFDYKPIYNRILEELSWNSVTNGTTTLFQKNQSIATYENFIDNPPQVLKNEINNGDQTTTSFQASGAQYYSIFDQSQIVDKQLQNYYSRATTTSTPFIEGGMRAYTYVQSESTLEITVDKIDNNYYDGADPLEIIVYDATGNEKLHVSLKDDGNITNNTQNGLLQSRLIPINGAHGLYTIVLIGMDTYSRLATNQPLLVVEDSLMIDESFLEIQNDPFTLFTEAYNVIFPTWHFPATNQTVIINGSREFILDDTRSEVKSVSLHLGQPEHTLNSITLNKNHVSIKTADTPVKRFFSFSKDSYFNPSPVTLTAFNAESDLADDSPIEYILTDYQLTQMKNGSMVTTLTFDLDSNSYFDDRTIQFALKIPDFHKTKNNFEIHSIDIELQR